MAASKSALDIVSRWLCQKVESEGDLDKLLIEVAASKSALDIVFGDAHQVVESKPIGIERQGTRAASMQLICPQAGADVR